jgi:hypothetical protein
MRSPSVLYRGMVRDFEVSLVMAWRNCRNYLMAGQANAINTCLSGYAAGCLLAIGPPP